ncbi:hypothetical protein BDW62DRAFT_150456 [Aspergillus aurantiobrunneus]
MATSHDFSLFPLLPTELRLQIWHESLPDNLSRKAGFLYYYKKGCWDPRHLTEADYDYDPHNDELNLNFEFYHDRLDPLKADVPLFSVNREARGSVLAWIKKQDAALKTRFCICTEEDKNKDKQQQQQSLLLTHPFNPELDTLYVSQKQWSGFLCEPFDRIFEPDLLDRLVNCPPVAFTRLAVPAALLREDPDALEELFDNYYGINKVFVIVEGRPEDVWHGDCDDDDDDDDDVRLREWWAVESQGPTYCWDPGSDGFQWRGNGSEGLDVSDYPLFKLLQDAGAKLCTKLLESSIACFEIQPAFAVRQ